MSKPIRRGLYLFITAIALLLSVEFVGMGYGYPQHELFHAPSPSAETWEQVFSRPGTIKLTSLETGRIGVPVSGVLNMDYPATEALSKTGFDVPVFAHWLHHPKFGDYLIDSGFDQSFTAENCGNIHGLLVGSVFGPCQQNVGEDVVSQLNRNQVKLNGVFFTHLHFDHTSGVPDLSGDLQYVAGPSDSYDNFPILLYRDHLGGVKKIQELDFSNARVMPPLGPSIDVFGDASLWAVATPGHTPGHVSYVINSVDGPVLLTGDASHTRWGFEHGVPPGWADDDRQAKKSLDQLIAFKQEFPNLEVRFGHEYSGKALLLSGRDPESSLVRSVN